MSEKKKETVNFDGENIGDIEERPYGRQIYVTKRSPETWVRIYNGFGITKEVVASLIGEVDIIEIHYKTEEGDIERYETTPERFLQEGKEDQLGDFETQYFLPANKFDRKTTMRNIGAEKE